MFFFFVKSNIWKHWFLRQYPPFDTNTRQCLSAAGRPLTWLLNYALRNVSIDFGHLVHRSPFWAPRKQPPARPTQLSHGKTPTTLRFSTKFESMFLPVSGSALPILVAKKPRMLLATRESPSRPPGPCWPARVSTVPTSRCTVWLTPATNDRSWDAAHAVIWRRGISAGGGLASRHAPSQTPLHWRRPTTSPFEGQSRPPRLC